MMNNNYFCRELNSGDALKPYMVSGTLEKNYTGDTDVVPYQRVNDLILEASSQIKNCEFCELDTFDLCEMRGKWYTFTDNAPQYAAGHYYVTEKLTLLPIYTVLESPSDQTAEIDIFADRFAVILNGELIFNNEDINFRKWPRVYVFEHVYRNNCETVKLNLKKGKNIFIYLGGSYGRGTGLKFTAKITKCEFPIISRIPLSIELEQRLSVETSIRKTYMLDSNLKYRQKPILHFEKLAYDQAYAEMRFKDQTVILKDEYYEFPENLSVASHNFKISWKLSSGSTIAEKDYSFGIYNVFSPVPGFENYEKRREKALQHLANKNDPLALYKLGRANEISVEYISAQCKKIIGRQDCADFHLLPLLWLVWEDRDFGHLDHEICKMIKEAALSFRYWVDEPGSSSMFYCSENHRIGFHVCEYLAGLLYPSDIFTNCNQNGMFHSLKGRMHLVEWLSQRCKMGFDEPHSDSYIPVTLSAILVLREILPREEYPLRNMVNVLLDFITFILATSNFDGIMATPRGRSYNAHLRTSLSSPVTAIFWMMFGNCEASSGSISPELAFSNYVPPKQLCELAMDYNAANFSFKEGLMHFDKHNADFIIRRTPDYMMGAVRDHNVGMCDMHFEPAMIALHGDITIFFSAPNTTAEGNGLRPDYWAGEAFLPRVLMYGRTMSVIWHDVKDPQIWMTHVHFNSRKFDEIVFKDSWTFGRKASGYVAIYSSAPHKLADEGFYAGRELIADGSECTWIANCGSYDEDGSFCDFIEKILNNKIITKDDGIEFVGPDGDLFDIGYDTRFNVNGNEVEIPDYLCKSPYLNSRFGSGKFEYNYNDFNSTQWTYPASE